MAVRIRLQRHGRKKRPFYRLVAADARAQRDGVFLERLGHYNPIDEPADVVIDEEKALKWLRRGAQPTDTAKRLLSQKGIWKKFTYEKLGKPFPENDETETVETRDDAETPQLVEEQEAATSEETSEPSEETSEPSEETSEPSEETSEPSEETSEPSEETSEPSEETSEPSEETSEPSEETSEPSEETSEPSEETSEPSEETSEPSEEE